MRNEVRQRIEQIRQGKVPAGYKKSAIGIFPEDWEIVSLSRFFSFKNGINAEKGSFGRGTKLISVKDILSEQAITYDSIQGMISLDEKQKEAFKVHYGDILFQRSSENYEDVGKSNVYLDKKRDAVFSGFVIRGQKIVDYDPVYLNEVLRLPYVRKQIQRLGAGAQHINIGQDSLKNVHIAVAGKKEQEKLTSICLQQMKVIRFKENLLAEKLRQKQYLMQVLLTGKKRLPGFSEKWKLVHLKDLCAYVRRRSVNSFDTYVNNENISSNLKGTVHFGEERNEVAGMEYRKGDILIGNIRPYLKKIWLADRDGICSPDILVLRPSNISSSCMYNLIATDTFFSYMMTGAGGSKMPRGDKKQVMEYPLQVPQSVKEQDEISHIFSLINEEIELLEQVLIQERWKKKALMQLLLSGIVRVKP